MWVRWMCWRETLVSLRFKNDESEWNEMMASFDILLKFENVKEVWLMNEWWDEKWTFHEKHFDRRKRQKTFLFFCKLKVTERYCGFSFHKICFVSPHCGEKWRELCIINYKDVSIRLQSVVSFFFSSHFSLFLAFLSFAVVLFLFLCCVLCLLLPHV